MAYTGLKCIHVVVVVGGGGSDLALASARSHVVKREPDLTASDMGM